MRPIIILLAAIMYFIGNRKKECINPVHHDSYLRDSFFIVNTVHQWKNLNISPYDKGNFIDSTKPGADYDVIVDTIIYNNTSQKLTATVIIKFDTAYLSDYSKGHPYYSGLDSKWLYKGRQVIGYLDSTLGYWKLYEFRGYQTAAFRDYQALRQKMRDFYFNEIKHRSTRGKNNKLVRYRYGVLDCDFWTKSIVWQRGLRKEGYYQFQLYDNGEIKEEVPVKYSEEILKGFK